MHKDEIRDRIFINTVSAGEGNVNIEYCFQYATKAANIHAKLSGNPQEKSIERLSEMTKEQVLETLENIKNGNIPIKDGNKIVVPLTVDNICDTYNVQNELIESSEKTQSKSNSSKERVRWNRFDVSKPPLKTVLEIKSDETQPYKVNDLSQSEIKYLELKGLNYMWRLSEPDWYGFHPSCERAVYRKPKNGKKIHFRQWMELTGEYIYNQFICITSKEAVDSMGEDAEWRYAD